MEDAGNKDERHADVLIAASWARQVFWAPFALTSLQTVAVPCPANTESVFFRQGGGGGQVVVPSGWRLRWRIRASRRQRRQGPPRCSLLQGAARKWSVESRKCSHGAGRGLTICRCITRPAWRRGPAHMEQVGSVLRASGRESRQLGWTRLARMAEQTLPRSGHSDQDQDSALEPREHATVAVRAGK